MSIDVIYNPKPKGKPMGEKLWSEKLIENEATSDVILSRQEWDSLIEGIQSLESELESARRDRGSGWEKFVSRLEAVSDRKHLESENAELREKLAAAENNLNDQDAVIRASGAELARYKSSSQWAVTTPRMSKESAERYAGLMADHGIQGRSDWFPVPLAPEDGPWVVMVHVDGNRYPSFWTGQQDYYTGLTEDANQFADYSVAQHAAREYTRKYQSSAWPVRLADVERESGKPDA